MHRTIGFGRFLLLLLSPVLVLAQADSPPLVPAESSYSPFGSRDEAEVFLRGATITDLGQFKGLMKEYERHDTAELWDVHVTDQIPTPPMARDLVALRAAR